MDKLRSLQYFVAAAEEKSLSGAARRFGVSTQAVAKLVSALERGLEVRLFERTAHGLTLTASGAAYLRSCLPALAQLQAADELMRAPSAPGTVVVGVQHVIAREVLTPALPRFHARYPQIRIDVHDFNRVADGQTDGVDVFLVLGWPQANELVLRAIAASRRPTGPRTACRAIRASWRNTRVCRSAASMGRSWTCGPSCAATSGWRYGSAAGW